MVRDLTQDLQAVYACSTLADKKAGVTALVEHSMATSATKEKAYITINTLMSLYKLDKFATNFVLSGEGMKVK